METKHTVEITPETPVQHITVAEVITQPNGCVRTYVGRVPTEWVERILQTEDDTDHLTPLEAYYKAVELDTPRGSKIRIYSANNSFDAVLLALQYLTEPDGTLTAEAGELWSKHFYNTGYIDGTWVLYGRTFADDERVGQAIADKLGKGFDRFDGMALQQVIYGATQGRGVLGAKANLLDWYSNSTRVGALAEELRDMYLF